MRFPTGCAATGRSDTSRRVVAIIAGIWRIVVSRSSKQATGLKSNPATHARQSSTGLTILRPRPNSLIEIKSWPDYSRLNANTVAVWLETMMDIREAIYGRRAVREFTTEPVQEAAIRKLVDAAIQAPSAVNRQPWLFTIVKDRELLARISDEAKTHILRTSAAALASHHFLHILNDPKFDIFYGAPVLIVISAAQGPWAIGDCALAAENLMLAAHAAGLGTCWIGFAKDWLETPDGKSILKLPETHIPVAPIIVGHPKSAPPAVPRTAPRIDWVS
jgi:nitroreductase